MKRLKFHRQPTTLVVGTGRPVLLCAHSRDEHVPLEFGGGLRQRVMDIGHRLAVYLAAILKNLEFEVVKTIICAKHASRPIVPRPDDRDFPTVCHGLDYGITVAPVSL